MKNYLLHWFFFNAIGYCGIQLKPIRLNDWKSIINMAINLFINLIILTNFVIKREFGWNTDPNDLNQTYKNFNHFISITTNYYAPFLWLFIIIYQYFNGKQLIRLMEQKSFQLIYNCRRQTLIVIITMIIFISPYIHEQFEEIFMASNQTRTIIRQLHIYCINLCYFLPLFFVNYVKYATLKRLQSLRKSEKRYNNHRYNSMMINKKILQEMKILSNLNRKFARIISPLLLACLLSYSFDIVAVFFWIEKTPVTLRELYMIFFGKKSSFWQNLFDAIIYHGIDHPFLMPMLLMVYVKYATIESIKLINYNDDIDSIDSQTSIGQQQEDNRIIKLNMERIKLEKFQNLAKLNRKFSGILSPLLLICIIAFNIDMITFFFWNINEPDFFETFLALSSYWLYLTYVIYLDEKIQKLLKKINENSNNENQFKMLWLLSSISIVSEIISIYR
ncbi:hypothetical protein DERP_009802 [Dermatophagoides pteronyssinus]|uniref:Gustatory receptor n=1 Tax=Dermatophagoides pteronyssinus TaxID=6956 RepID=A0ABQ8IR68_DERPT|nr:hypothetical protein DERP_009802 [Dermatophagoides pteronyssinus]